MATITGKTSAKIDELIGESIIGGSVDANGHLILTTRDGATLDGGFVTKPFGESWSAATAYASDDVVGYAGVMWKALNANTNKVPALNTDMWTRLTGFNGDVWSERDSLFVGNSVAESYDVATKTGAPTVAYSQIAGEFEHGFQSLKVTVPTSGSQTIFQKEENLVRGGETVTVTVRARLLSAAAGARLNVRLLQNKAVAPTPGSAGLSTVNASEGAQALTTAWTTFTFSMAAVDAKPRAMVNLVASADAAGSAIFLVDRIKITRGSSAGLLAWPVGSVFIGTTPTNPNSLLGGGTWEQWAVGKMPIGIDPADPDFDSPEETGGSKTYTLAVANLPPHTHTINHNHGAVTVNFQYTVDTQDGGSKRRVTDIQNQTGGGGTSDNAVVDLPTYSGNSGAGTGTSSPINNMPPFITCYMWKRTA